MSSTFLSSWALHRKFCVSIALGAETAQKTPPDTLWISVHLQGSCSLQAGRTLWEMSYALPSTLRGWTKITNISCPRQYQQFLLAQAIRATASVSGVSKPLSSWMCPVITDVWSGKSSQTLCFTEIWNCLSWNETNLDNSIPTLQGKTPCLSPEICSTESSIWVPVSDKPLTPWLAHYPRTC